MRRGRFSIATAAVLLLGLIFAGSAFACSCVNRDPAEALAESDAAVVGRLLGVESSGDELPGMQSARFEYKILRVYRGRKFKPGGTLVLHSSLSGASCGLPRGIGRHYGLFLGWGGGQWRSSLCSVVSPPDMRAAARDLKAAGASGASGAASCAV